MNAYLFDKRVVRRNMKAGMTNQKEYLAHLAGLEDLESQCEPVEERLYPEDDDKESGEDATDATPEL